MKIGIDARFVGSQGTGLGKYAEKLILNLAKIDKKNEYLIFLRQNNFDYLKTEQGNFKKVLADIPWYSAKEQVYLPKIFKSQNLDILHAPHFNAPIFYRHKFVITIHDLIHHKFAETSATTKNPLTFKLKRFGYKKVIENAIYKSQKIITPSNFVKEDILKNFNIEPSKIVVTYEAAEEEYFQKSGKLKIESGKFLLYVGNAYPHKNLNRLLDALKILNSQLSTLNSQLIIVCPRDVFSSRLEEEIEKRSLQKSVEIRGYLDPEELAKLFQKASAYVFPSLSEGFGIPGLNAMASGLPVIASNIPVLKEIYGDAAIYFDPIDPKDIASKINQAVSGKGLRANLIDRGCKRVQKYSWLKMAKETLKVYEGAI